VVAAATPGFVTGPPVLAPQPVGVTAAPGFISADPPSLIAPRQPAVITTVEPFAPQTTAPQQPTVQAAEERPLDGRGIPLLAVLLTGAGAALLLGGLWRVPGALLPDIAAVRCPLEENP
jgi:hypothetical protein